MIFTEAKSQEFRWTLAVLYLLLVLLLIYSALLIELLPPNSLISSDKDEVFPDVSGENAQK